MTINHTETEERAYLHNIVTKLQSAVQGLDDKISSTYHEVIEAKKYIYDNIAGLDPAERAANRIEVSMAIGHGEKTIDKRRKLRKLMDAPYFGRVDFVPGDRRAEEAYYIGVHSFVEGDSGKDLIYDWRSPVASMFYDYETGKAAYSAPSGELNGEIVLKRQYKIQNGIMEYMIESSMNIRDDVLQKELSQTSDRKMKDIVATIQKEQNAIIRNEHSRELIIQGVAGSGKTSVALHRIAFLLYRYKETLTSDHMMIISPNKVFSDYISNVLPELGEENIPQISFDELAASLLQGVCAFQTFSEQVTELMDSGDDSLQERVRFKARVELVEELERFTEYVREHYFEPDDLSLEDVHIEKSEILRAYQAAGDVSLKQKLEKTASVIAAGARDADGDRISKATANNIKTAVKKMFKTLNVLAIYKDFYSFIEKPEMFRMKPGKKLEFCDVFPLVYLKLLLEGASNDESVKHLLIDEMQDYTPIQYAVIARLFPCKKTILGDASQSVNPYSSSSTADIQKVFAEADTVELLTSYRSTKEIIEFAKNINRNSRITPIERHGSLPQILSAADNAGEWKHITQCIEAFRASGHHSLGVIGKSPSQAKQLYEQLKGRYENVHLLDFNSDRFHEGIIITYTHLAKGLEFDQVLVPFVNEQNYKTEMDRSLLYIACTRAMHALSLSFHGKPSSFIEDELHGSQQ